MSLVPKFLRTEHSGSAREKYLAQGSSKAQDAADRVEAKKQVEAEKREKKQAASKVRAAESKVRKCADSKVKPGAMKCGNLGSGIYCNKHRREGTTITNG
jgi:hypothetical protein